MPKCFTGCFQRVDGVQSFVEKIMFIFDLYLLYT